MTTVDKIRQDLMYLAGSLMHRGALTHDERRAAMFIRQRFREYTSQADFDEFATIDNYPYLFASYLTEFLVVAILAVWWPAFAAGYGAVVLLAYLAEFMGYRIFARFLPQFESQNVVARLNATRPERLFIVTAHYDSGCANLLTHPNVLPWMRSIYIGVFAAMAAVIATCVTDAFGLLVDADYPLTLYIRWAAVVYLLTTALVFFYSSARGEDVRGANCNASGVAALLVLAERMAAQPLDNADVWFVATGSHEAWNSGMRHFLSAHDLDRPYTHILNLESVGAGQLHYLTQEGILPMNPSDPALVEAAEAVAPRHGVTPARFRAVPTAAHVPLARGYKIMTVMALDEDGLPGHWNWFTDRVTEVDENTIAAAADFAEATLRRLEADVAGA